MTRGDVRAVDASPDGTDRRSFLRANLIGNGYEATIAASIVLTGLLFIAWPSTLNDTAVSEAAPVIGVVWALFYVVGGVLILCGLCIHAFAVEAVGLIFLAFASTLDAVALLLTRGPASGRIILLYLALVAGSALRIYLIVRLARLEAVDPFGP